MFGRLVLFLLRGVGGGGGGSARRDGQNLATAVADGFFFKIVGGARERTNYRMGGAAFGSHPFRVDSFVVVELILPSNQCNHP